jgi:hypothetical protein
VIASLAGFVLAAVTLSGAAQTPGGGSAGASPSRSPSSSGAAQTPGAIRKPNAPTSAYAIRTMRGWTVRVHRDLLGARSRGAADGIKAVELLDAHLLQIAHRLPAPAVAELRKVVIWLGVNHGHAPCAEYHPSREFLVEHGYNPAKARCVEIGCAQKFVEWSRIQPSIVLHELAHAYHDQVLGFDNPEVEAAYAAARASGAYEAVLHADGRKQRHYAMTDAKEYFAELTEAMFGVNDFYPFVRAELAEHDPRGYALLRRLWKADPRLGGSLALPRRAQVP